jgi:hypothetical protein
MSPQIEQSTNRSGNNETYAESLESVAGSHESEPPKVLHSTAELKVGNFVGDSFGEDESANAAQILPEMSFRAQC